MSTVYSPNTANNPASITLASDGEAKPVATVNVGLEGVFDLAGRLRALITGVLDGAGILSFLNAVLTNPLLHSPTMDGTIEVDDPILGDGSALGLSQGGETTTVHGSTVFAGSGESHTFNGPVVIQGNAAIEPANTVLNGGAIQNSGNGFIGKRVINSASSSSLSVDPTTCDAINVFASAAGHTIALQDGPAFGSISGTTPYQVLWIRLYAFTTDFVAVSGTGMTTIHMSTQSGDYLWVDKMWNGAAWVTMGAFINP